METLIWETAEDARTWVRHFVARLNRPSAVLLAGEMGAGKTQVVKWCLGEMGVQGVTSPTFAIHQRYPTSRGDVDHLDLYRLQTDAELDAIGFWDLLAQPDGLLFVEWADRLPANIWPATWSKIWLTIEQPDKSSDRRRFQVLFS